MLVNGFVNQREEGGRRLIAVPQYPIVNDGEGRKGKTENEIIANLTDFVSGKSDYFDTEELAWVDLIQLSSSTTNNVIDHSKLATIITHHDVVLDYMLRISAHLSVFDETAIPCLYIAGRPPQKSFNEVKTMGVVQLVKTVSILHHINMYRMNGEGLCSREFCVLEDRVHPSAHYHNQDRDEFKATMQILKGTGNYLATLISIDVDVVDCSAICLEAMDLYVNAALGVSEKEHQASTEGLKFMTR